MEEPTTTTEMPATTTAAAAPANASLLNEVISFLLNKETLLSEVISFWLSKEAYLSSKKVPNEKLSQIFPNDKFFSNHLGRKKGFQFFVW